MKTDTTMSEVVQRLRAEDHAAIMELREFAQTLEAFLQYMDQIDQASLELHAAARSTDEFVLRSLAVQEQTQRLSVLTRRFSGAFRQLHSAVGAWNVASAHCSGTA